MSFWGWVACVVASGGSARAVGLAGCCYEVVHLVGADGAGPDVVQFRASSGLAAVDAAAIVVVEDVGSYVGAKQGAALVFDAFWACSSWSCTREGISSSRLSLFVGVGLLVLTFVISLAFGPSGYNSVGYVIGGISTMVGLLGWIDRVFGPSPTVADFERVLGVHTERIIQAIHSRDDGIIQAIQSRESDIVEAIQSSEVLAVLVDIRRLLSA